MANGDGASDAEAFVLRSGVRSGLKREFAFALRSQSLVPASLGRTRSGKALGSPASGLTFPREGKRPKKAVGDSDSVVGFENGVALGLGSDSMVVDVGDGGVVERMDDAVVPVQEESSALPAVEAQKDDLGADAVILDAGALGNAGGGEASLEMGRDECSLPEKPPLKVFVRSHSRGKGLSKSPPLSDSGEVKEVEIPVLVADGNGACELNVELQGNCCAADEAVVVGNTVEPLECGLEDRVDGPAGENPPSSVVLEKENIFPSLIDVQVSSKWENGVSERPVKRFTRSSVKATPDVKDNGSMVNVPVTEFVQESSVNDSVLDKPTRRFTRSALKSKTSDVASTSCESNGSQEVKGQANCGYGTVTSDLKMSKKITLKKIPGNARELLSTGLLEGLPVKYITNAKQIGLEGVIKGNGILCSCSACRGTTVVSAYMFELHAGSTKKHPADFIFLKNGHSLHDVVIACRQNSLDMLETTIRDAIGEAPSKKIFSCQQCKESFLTKRSGMFALLCDSCLESKQSLKSALVPSVGAATPRTKVVSSSAPDNSSVSSNKKSSAGRLTRKDLGLHKLVFMSGVLPEGTEVGYYVRGKKLLEGYIKDSGIFCRCCDTVVSPSQFESHAGQALRRKPYNYIYTSNGVSLHELSVSLSKTRKLSASENDDLCSICKDYGNLILCDLCPRAFHKECVGLSSIPGGQWHCQHCVNLQKMEKSFACNDNAIAAGRVEGVDPIEQIFKQCIRIVSITDIDDTSCALCKSHEFSKFGFNDNTVMICDQCGKEYHVKCLRDHKMADLKEVPEGEWFCSTDCDKICNFLLENLTHGPKPIPDLDANLIKQKCEGRKGININIADIRWRLLSGRTDTKESNLLLSSAVEIIRESFAPIVDRTGRDLIPTMVYGRASMDQDYGGTYCVVLTVGSSVLSAGTLRVMGRQVAELPVVATSREYQGLGLFQALFSCIQTLLVSLKVKHLVLPAADEAKSIWTDKFGFTTITSEQLEEHLDGTRTTVFHGTSYLYKLISVS